MYGQNPATQTSQPPSPVSPLAMPTVAPALTINGATSPTAFASLITGTGWLVPDELPDAFRVAARRYCARGERTAWRVMRRRCLICRNGIEKYRDESLAARTFSPHKCARHGSVTGQIAHAGSFANAVSFRRNDLSVRPI